jgi:hypothetical protein
LKEFRARWITSDNSPISKFERHFQRIGSGRISIGKRT